ncbi:hypothetical protein MNB_SV-14-1028 [hydrothermal vent metagenome]|uniref:Uncharacterized protein n=1 Tax=hydrothermal vent metagenome TaxID=652676 RepID=A0A1W1CCY1_9ZZZZ
MLDETIKSIADTKISASGILLTGSSATLTYGVMTVSYQDLILGFAGFLLSVFSFYYAYTHETEEKNRHQILSEMFRHLIFGTFAFPAMYSFMVLKFNLSFSINIFIAVVISYSIMRFVDVGLSGALAFLKAWLKDK